MKNLIICTDGSSTKNGKPDCIGGFGAWLFDCDTGVSQVVGGYETHSTSQRAELYAVLHGLATGLLHISEEPDDYSVTLVTDSGYIANCIKQEWYTKWARFNWVTSTGSPVKNRDLWEKIVDIIGQYPFDCLQVCQIKGHLWENFCKRGNIVIEEGMRKFMDTNFQTVGMLGVSINVFKKFMFGNDMADAVAKSYVADAKTMSDDEKMIRSLKGPFADVLDSDDKKEFLSTIYSKK